MVEPGALRGITGLVRSSEVVRGVVTTSRERDDVVDGPPPPVLSCWIDGSTTRATAIRNLALPAVTLQDVSGGPFLPVGTLLECPAALLCVSFDLANTIGIGGIPTPDRLGGALAVLGGPPTADRGFTTPVRLLPEPGSLDYGLSVSPVPRAVVFGHASFAPQR
jgi:hypothetical protein